MNAHPQPKKYLSSVAVIVALLVSLFIQKKYNPFEKLNNEKIKQLGDLNYYSEAIHRASFQLPQFLHKRLNQKSN